MGNNSVFDFLIRCGNLLQDFSMTLMQLIIEKVHQLQSFTIFNKLVENLLFLFVPSCFWIGQ